MLLHLKLSKINKINHNNNNNSIIYYMHLVCFALQSVAFFGISQSIIEANLIFGIVVITGICAIVFFEKESLWKVVKKLIQMNERLS